MDQGAIAETSDAAVHHLALAVGAARGDAVFAWPVQDLHLKLKAPRVRMLEAPGAMVDEALFRHHCIIMAYCPPFGYPLWDVKW